MTKAAGDADSELLAFVQKHYDDLKAKAEADNIDSKQEKITVVIKLIDDLLNTVLATTSTHDTIAHQLKAFYTEYDALKLGVTDATYTRYNDAFESLNMIVDRLNEVEEEPGVGGEELEPGAGTEGA